MRKKEKEDVSLLFLTNFSLFKCYINNGDDMKKKIRGLIVPVVIAIFIGYIGGKFAYHTYRDNLYDTLRSSRLYLVERGSYDTIDTMRQDNNDTNYVYYKDDDKYKTVVGITKDYNNVKKIKSLYSDNVSVMEYYVANEIINSKQDEYEKELNKAEDYKEVKEAVDNILNLYRSDDAIRLIAID